jgi:hypothetical protein
MTNYDCEIQIQWKRSERTDFEAIKRRTGKSWRNFGFFLLLAITIKGMDGGWMFIESQLRQGSLGKILCEIMSRILWLFLRYLREM